mmetsp:Transcript_34926/g.104184  ORF Transcript_34926/g.104184 Transcript_34926/m.104184 type:complete len:86 (+) Transcript_34926:990-1247(+)
MSCLCCLCGRSMHFDDNMCHCRKPLIFSVPFVSHLSSVRWTSTGHWAQFALVWTYGASLGHENVVFDAAFTIIFNKQAGTMNICG